MTPQTQHADFWKDSEYAETRYVEQPPTADAVADIEAELGYKLPAAYVALAQSQNGGFPLNNCHPSSGPTSWATDHVALHGIFAIGREAERSLCGLFGSKWWMDGWDYPDIGVYFADCPSGGHDMLCLDYRACGPQGEPIVVHVDQEDGFKVTFLASNFQTFLEGLYPAADA